MARLRSRRVAAVILAVAASFATSTSTGAATRAWSGLLTVACGPDGSCTTLGYRESDKQRVVALGGRGGAVTLQLPANGSRLGAKVFATGFPEPNWANSAYIALSCPSRGNCAAVGGYLNNRGDYDGVLFTETNGHWARGVEEGLPANALKPRSHARHQSNDPTAVSCAAAGECTAIGFYTDEHGLRQGLLLSETNGSWQRGVQASLPADAFALDPFGGVELESVSCPAPGSCTVVGEYEDERGTLPGVILTETNGQWTTGIRAPVPAGISHPYSMPLEAVSCASPGNCTAVGSYNFPGHKSGGVLLTETNGQWSSMVAPLPPDHAAKQFTSGTSLFLNAVSCAAPGECTAVGDYVARGGHQRGLLLTEHNGAWTSADAQLPAGAWRSGIGPAATLKSVSCASPGNCTVVGDYFTGGRGAKLVPLVLTETAGRWAKGVTPRLPAGAASKAPDVSLGPDFAEAGLFSVSCASPGSCTAVGQYPQADKRGTYAGIRVIESHGHVGRAAWVKTS